MRRVDYPSKMGTLQTDAIIDIEAQQASVAPKVAKLSHAATPSLCTKVRSWAWPSLYAVVGAAGYTGAIFVWYQHQIAQARPLPFQLGDTEQAGNVARMLAAPAPFAGAAGAALGAYLHRSRR